MNPTTTLARIREKSPCSEGWAKLLTGLGYADGNFDSQRIVSLGDIATTNDAKDAIWSIRALDWNYIAVRRAVLAGAVLPAVKRAATHTKNQRVHDAVADLERWCAGDDTIDLENVRKSVAAYAAYATDATASAAYATYATYAATAAAAYATYAADAADAAYAAYAERKQQRLDIIAAFPPVALGALSVFERETAT